MAFSRRWRKLDKERHALGWIHRGERMGERMRERGREREKEGRKERGGGRKRDTEKNRE